LFLPGPVRLGIVLIQYTSDVSELWVCCGNQHGSFGRIVLWCRVSLCWILARGDVGEQRIEDMTYNTPKNTALSRLPPFLCGTARFEETGMDLLSDSHGAVKHVLREGFYANEYANKNLVMRVTR